MRIKHEFIGWVGVTIPFDLIINKKEKTNIGVDSFPEIPSFIFMSLI